MFQVSFSLRKRVRDLLLSLSLEILRSILRHGWRTTKPTAICDPIFASEIEDGDILRFSKSKNEDIEVLQRQRGFFEDRGFLEDGESSSKMEGFGEPQIFEELPIFDLPAAQIEDLRSRKTKKPPSSIFDLRPRRSKNPPIFDFRLRRMGRRSDGRPGGGWCDFFEDVGGALRRWGGFFNLAAPKKKEPHHLSPSWLEERRTPSIFHLRGRKNEQPSLVSLPPLDQWLPAPLSYPGIWIFRPIFHFEDLSEDRGRPSTRLSAGRQPLFVHGC